MSTKYRVYCTEPGDEGFQYVWSDTVPTECPNDAGHSINVASIIAVSILVPTYRETVHNTKIKSKDYFRISTILYNKKMGEIKKIKVLSFMDQHVTDYSVEVILRSDFSNIAEAIFTNTTSNINDLGTIQSIPDGDVEIEVNIKRTSSKNNKHVHIEKIIFYTEKKI